MHHTSEYFDWKYHELALGQRLTVELPLEQVCHIKYLLQAATVINCARYDIYLTEIITFTDFNIYYVVLSALFFENKSSCALDEKVNAFDRIVFNKDKLVLLDQEGHQLRAQPCHKLFRLVLHKIHP